MRTCLHVPKELGMRKIIIKVSTIIFAAFILSFATATPAYASGFDAAYYAAKYPDVHEAFGDDVLELYNHYLNFGMDEGRFKNAEEEAEGVPATTIDTYVDVDIENQTMTYYVDGEAVLTSPCVTGKESTGNSTPRGRFVLRAKVPGKNLVGPTWNVWVDRWMRFTTFCGLHDASWRGKFGGQIYKKNGSHGCVNLPKDVAYQLYDMIEIGTAVIVH